MSLICIKSVTSESLSGLLVVELSVVVELVVVVELLEVGML